MPLGIQQLFNPALKAGLIAGHKLVNKSGKNEDAGMAEENIQFGGGILVPLLAGVKIEAISNNAADSAAGSNARMIRIHGVNDNFEEISEFINLNGLSVTSLTNQNFLRVFDAEVVSVGTYNTTNAGEINIRVSGGGATQLLIEAGRTSSKTTHYTIPADKTGFLFRIGREVDSFPEPSSIIFERRGNSSMVLPPFDPVENDIIWNGTKETSGGRSFVNLKIPEKTDIWVNGIAGVPNTLMEVDFTLLVVNNSTLRT